MRLRPTTLLWLVVPPVAASAAMGLGLLLRDNGPAGRVEIRDNGVPVGSVSANEAVTAIQSKLPFKVRVPKSGAGGLELWFVDAGTSPTSGQPFSVLGYRNDEPEPTLQTTLTISQSDRQIPGAATADMPRLDAGIPGADVRWFPRPDADEVYYFVTYQDVYLLVIAKGVVPPQEETLAMIRSALEPF